MNLPPASRRPIIGVFDSGFGGLTVLRALLPLIPGAQYLYLGDTARLPYGAKSQATIARYAVESARFLAGKGAEHLVIACNTATALALNEITAAVDIPVTGVIAPVVEAAAHAVFSPPTDLSSRPEAAHFAAAAERPAASPSHPTTLSSRPEAAHCAAAAERPAASPPHPTTLSSRPEAAHFAAAAERPAVLSTTPQILVLATDATVQSHAYRDACATLSVRAIEKACPLLVPLIEEGWIDHPVTREVLRIYLREALSTCTPAVVILGCTHYPLIAPLVSETLRELGSQATVVDSPHATAQAVATTYTHLANTSEPATFFCYATDSVEKFARLGTQFLGREIPTVHLLDLGG